MNTQEKNVQQETNDCVAQAKPVKRALRATDLRHMPGMAVQTGIKGGDEKRTDESDRPEAPPKRTWKKKKS